MILQYHKTLFFSTNNGIYSRSLSGELPNIIFYNKYLALSNLDNQYEILQKTLFIINKSVSIQVQYYGQIPDSVCLSTVKESCKKPSSKPINENTIEYNYTFSTEDLTKKQTLYFRIEDEEAANSR